MSSVNLKKFKDSGFANFLLDMGAWGKEYASDILSIGFSGSRYVNAAKRFRQFGRLGYFDISKRNNKSFFKLTPKGFTFLELLKFAAGKIKWDKKWRVLIFDIPEKEKHKRVTLRRKLKELGFHQLQKSVWVTPYPLPEIFSKFLADIRVRPYLYSLTVDALNRENELKKIFNLK